MAAEEGPAPAMMAAPVSAHNAITVARRDRSGLLTGGAACKPSVFLLTIAELSLPQAVISRAHTKPVPGQYRECQALLSCAAWASLERHMDAYDTKDRGTTPSLPSPSDVISVRPQQGTMRV